MATYNKRTIKSKQQLDILNSFYNDGMISYNKDDVNARNLMAEAVKKNDLTEKQVKVKYYLVDSILRIYNNISSLLTLSSFLLYHFLNHFLNLLSIMFPLMYLILI